MGDYFRTTQLRELTAPAADDAFIIVDDDEADDAIKTKRIAYSALMGKSPTLHFHRSDAGGFTVAATPGTFDPDAAAELIRLNVPNDDVIETCHLHVERGGAGVDLGFDVFRYRPSDGTHTFLAHVELAGTVADNAYDSAAPAGALTDLIAGDYLKCQATALTLGGVAGVTIDVHFAVRGS